MPESPKYSDPDVIAQISDLSLRSPVKYALAANTCEDVPAWWLLKKKKTMFDFQGVRKRG